ncbi:MAG: fatty acid desaturase [Aphanocapsa lilacina HA4352-LM1]|nr:fatty acid desaturase [Aphanocapsa lilacina HA4352-LM1]
MTIDTPAAGIRTHNRKLLHQLERVTYREVLDTIPKKCFARNTLRGLEAVVLHLGVLAGSYALFAVSPIWLAPLFWVWIGTVLWGNFVLAHDCGHQSFSPYRRLNALVGHLLLLPTLYPFHSWRIMHNRHHAWTNHQDNDNSWRTIAPETYAGMNDFNRFFYRHVHTWAWWFASVIHLFIFHYDKKKFRPQEWPEARFSIAVNVVFAAVALPGLFWITGFWEVLNYWVLPWLVFHFWLSTFTLIHHNHPDIPYFPESEWTPLKAQLFGTVHCEYPWWVELVAYRIGVHIPHHLSTAIPYYHLDEAHAALKARWPEYVHEARFTWPYLRSIVTTCHLSGPEGYHLPIKRARVVRGRQ